ncbi:unnamed protein product [Peronospora effusa]|nr:unnamed protein product [Peronospora effusa]
MESPYDLILGMPYLAKHQPWIDWRTRTVASSTQDTGKDILLREAYVADAMSNTVEGAMTVCQSTPGTTQLERSGVVGSALAESQVTHIPTQVEKTGVVNGAMTSSHALNGPAQSRELVAVYGGLTGSEAPQEPAQSQEPGAIGRSALSEIPTTPSSRSKVVVIQKTSTRRIKTIKGTSKRVTLGSVSVQEDGPTNELFEAVEEKMPEASSVEVLQLVLASAEEMINLSEMTWDLFLSELKEGKIHEIVAPVPEENVVDCCFSSTMD